MPYRGGIIIHTRRRTQEQTCRPGDAVGTERTHFKLTVPSSVIGQPGQLQRLTLAIDDKSNQTFPLWLDGYGRGQGGVGVENPRVNTTAWDQPSRTAPVSRRAALPHLAVSLRPCC